MGKNFSCAKKIPKIEIRSDCCHNEASYTIEKCRHCQSMIRIPRQSENQKKEREIVSYLID